MLVPLNEIKLSTERFISFSNSSRANEIKENIDQISFEDYAEPVMEKVKEGNLVGDLKNRVQRKQMIASFGLEPTDFAFERAIGKNDSVYSNFIDLIYNVKQKIGRIVVKDGADNLSYATGFMISEELLMTNWHVFKEKEKVRNSQIEFYYELDDIGNSKLPVIFDFNPDAFFYSFQGLDYCIVAVNKVDVSKKHQLSSIGYIYLDPTSGKLGDENEESLNIIHHPNGDYKQLSIRENKFTKILETTIWYESDTAQGSSGAPVFNDQWQIVALHHMGVPKRNNNGDYLDVNDNIIPVIGDKIDISKIHWIANEGIRISVILKDLRLKFQANNPYIQGIEKTTSSKSRVSQIKNEPSIMNKNETKHIRQNKHLVNVSFPPSLFNTHKKINFSFSLEGDLNMPKAFIEKKNDIAIDSFLEESKRLERSIDYSQCKGYQSDFLGVNIPIPKPIKKLNHQKALILGTDSSILKYYKFSVIHNAVRKMPFISAINIDGSEDLRKDKSKRIDRWIRDRRIDYEVQLDSKFYTNSGFDKGHISRREDANWGRSAEEAKRNADLTCVYTNACPQVPTLNRSGYNGLWGKLEKEILEYGAEKEDKSTNKISVFGGPIFKEDNPTYKGVQIPTEYYKIIVWLSDVGVLKATSFVLSQVDLLGNINLEAIDLDKNIKFKQHMRSIKSIQSLTGIDFSHIFEFDTFRGNQNEAIEIDSEESLKKQLQSK